jgi:hypothetical protein
MREKPILFLKSIAPVIEFIDYTFHLTLERLKNGHITGRNLPSKYSSAQKITIPQSIAAMDVSIMD